MRISKEEALEFASASKKLHLVKAGWVWLFCPYMPAAAYHSVHYMHEDGCSVQCDGPGCTICPRRANKKVHIPSLVMKKPYRKDVLDSLKFPQDVHYDPRHWAQKIFELTANCFKPLEQPSQPNQLGVAWRQGDSRNSPLNFKWIPGILKGIPADLEDLSVDKILPGIIGGTYRNAHETTPLDNSADGRIKHKFPYQTDNDENNDCNGIGGAA